MSTRVATGLLDRRRALAQARHRRRRTALLAALGGSALLAGTWWIATGPLLAVTHVEISGYRQADQGRVVQTIQIAGRRATMLKLPTTAIREALARFPWVADVHVHHNWPRGMDVRIVQATPAAVAETASGTHLLISESGRVLGEDGTGTPLPGYRLPQAQVGAWLRGPAQRAPFEFLMAMAPDAARRVSDLRLEAGVLVGRLVDGPELRIGPPSHAWEKGRALEAILASPKVAESLGTAEYLDVSAPSQPTLGGIPGREASPESSEAPPVSTSGAQPEASTEGQPST